MSYAYIAPRARSASPFDRRPGGEHDLAIPTDLDLCRGRLPSANADGARLAAASRASQSKHAFRPAFTAAEWSTFASFCVARRLPAGARVLVPGEVDRSLRFVVEGCLRQQEAAAGAGMPADLLRAGCIVGEDTLFSDAPGALDVRAVEDSLVLELTWPRRNELSAANPETAFEMLRAAGAVMAARLLALMARGEPLARRA